ncbi:hypothetical protein [Herbaspirillum sp. RV1423]|uniref:hypothetical protein n=1 Tax=Herbaspirillum sp. RV1423 TaxID=1443993 RepID=UPI0004B0DD03|nr:hypothetical protein [Herbaspirillum sp. RV1423]
MRFQRLAKRQYRETHQKRTAIVRRQRRELETDFPLFAAEISERQLPVDQEIDQLRALHDRQQRETRTARAHGWVTARARIRAMGAPAGRTVLNYWNSRSKYPAHPEALHRLITRFERGQVKP